MAQNKDYTKAKARKKTSNSNLNLEEGISKSERNKAIKKVKKSPILIVCLIFLIIGGLAGFFSFSYLSAFEMKDFYVNGVVSQENDYIIVDVSQVKETLLLSNPDASTQEIFDSIVLKDDGVECKLFGIDVKNTVTVNYYYREDISNDAEKVDKIDVSTPGVYYVEYVSSNFAFKNVKLIRTVVVTGVENDG